MVSPKSEPSGGPMGGRVETRESGTDPLFDPSWLFVVAGLAILCATILIPAADDLAHARWLRDRALLLEKQRLERLSNYAEYRGALEEARPQLVMFLAGSQLNQIPADRRPIPGLSRPDAGNASVFEALEPSPVVLPERRRIGSLLERWTTNDRTRTWLLAGGAISLLVGLLPRATATRARA